MPPSPQSGHAHDGRAYSVEPRAAPGDHPRPAVGAAPVPCARMHPDHLARRVLARPLRDGLRHQRQPRAPIRHGHFATSCLRPQISSTFLENAPRGRFGHRVVFSQDLALQLANGLSPCIFFRRRTGLKVCEDLGPPFRDLRGIQALASQLQTHLVLREPCRLNAGVQLGLSRPVPVTSSWRVGAPYHSAEPIWSPFSVTRPLPHTPR